MKREFIKANDRCAEEICLIVQRTIREVYPNYYPQEVVEFFCDLHGLENISKDIATEQVYVLSADGKIIGTGSAKDNHITRVYVLPEFQKMGCGGKIMSELENMIAKQYDCAFVDASLPALHMYEHLGYKTLRRESMKLKSGTMLVYDVMSKCL